MNLLSCRLKALRLERGYSKTAGAMAIGVSRRAVYGWESDTMAPTIVNVVQLARFLSGVHRLSTGFNK